MPIKKVTTRKVALKQPRGKDVDYKIVTDLPSLPTETSGQEPVKHNDARDLELVELDEIIHKLMQRRATLARSKVEPAPEGKFIRGVRQPELVVATDVMTGDTLVHIRYAGVGWFSFTLSEKQVQGLLPILMQHQATRTGHNARQTYNG